MTDDTQAAPTATAPAPALTMVGQYIRDLSFENPGAPDSILGGGPSPALSFNISLATKKQPNDVYAVEMTLLVKAEREGKVVFNVELVYGGVFVVKGFTEQQVPQVLLIECPRQTFPFARQVVANVIQQGGFPPVLLQPIDFQALFRQNLAAAAAQLEKQRATAQNVPTNN